MSLAKRWWSQDWEWTKSKKRPQKEESAPISWQSSFPGDNAPRLSPNLSQNAELIFIRLSVTQVLFSPHQALRQHKA